MFRLRSLPLIAFILVAQCVSAQQARKDISANVRFSASNYLAYPVPTKALTLAPAGYEPFYISAYARHGSRYLINPNDYRHPLRTLQRADSAGVLTAAGKDVLAIVDSLSRMSNKRLGELTPLGARQHQGIATRMYRNFPEVFSGQTNVDARSTIVIRCILSMLNECMTLKSFNPLLNITTDASEHDMYYMNDEYNSVTKHRSGKEARASLAEFIRQHASNPARLMQVLFTDTAYVNAKVKPSDLMDQLFDLASNMQSHDTKLDLYHYFTNEECYDQWLCANYYWYLNYGPSPLTAGALPYTQANLLRNILDTADSCVQLRHPGATLRFGHEVCVLPLASLMELNDCGYSTENADSVALRWRNYEIFPMASNIQLIFYRNKSNNILVKVLLNEREARLPIKTTTAPYYPWNKVEAYYRHKLSL